MKIGNGWQYSVHEFDNNRVIKTPLSRDDIKQYFVRKFENKEIEIIVDKLINDREKSIEGLKRRDIDMSLLGNPIFLENGKYLQDKVLSIGSYIEDCLNNKDVHKARKIINSYTDFNITSWKNGFSDIIYNFTRNCGAYPDGKVILIDLGEITFSKEDIENTIKEKTWLKKASYKKDLDIVLKEHYRMQMEKKMTLENLERCWKEAPLLV